MKSKREYGKAGTIGIGVPQANTTVEAEFRALVPAGVNLITARLQGSRTDSRQRLLDYFETLETTIETFDSAPLSAFGFACTGSSYLLGVQKDRAAFAELSKRRGYPVVPATEAILESLRHLGARSIALVSPYPAWLTEAAAAYYRDAGIEVSEVVQVAADTADTRNVYDVTSADAVAAAGRLKRRDADAILLSGTGMPTLRAIGELARQFGKPVLSSTLCLAWVLGKRMGIAGAPPWEQRSAWEARLQDL
ncbi:MAG: aspartate/glutamate racemase family protein [Betaproteobacteria bacterium]